MTERPESQGGTDGSDNGTPNEQIIAIAINSLKRSHEAAQQQSYKQERSNLCWTRLTAVSGIVYTIFTGAILAAAIYTAWISHRTFVAGQRAFVHLDKVDWHPVEKEQYTNAWPFMLGHGLDKRKVVEITIWLTNSGNTPASPLFVDTICPKSDSKVQEPFSLFSWNKSRAIEQVIGPKQTIEIGPCDNLSPEDIGKNAAGFIPRYVIGEIRYRDLVEPERERITQFALQLRFFNEDLDALKGRSLPVGKHNCTDDNCPK
jgi:hypothetical protein